MTGNQSVVYYKHRCHALDVVTFRTKIFNMRYKQPLLFSSRKMPVNLQRMKEIFTCDIHSFIHTTLNRAVAASHSVKTRTCNVTLHFSTEIQSQCFFFVCKMKNRDGKLSR